MACSTTLIELCATSLLLKCALLLRLGFQIRGNFVSGEKEVPLMALHLEEGDWRPIAEQASREMDPQKLMILVEKLCCALDGERREKSRTNEPGSFTGS